MRPLVLMLLCTAALTPLTARAAGDAQNGRAVAQTWCANCHALGRPQSATDAAPSFVTIAQHGRADPARLRVWLTDPHPPMPNPGLSRQEIEDVIAYLQELAPR
jgi:mono/diheme cytochrome c family protein